jgi:hypothetical protein
MLSIFKMIDVIIFSCLNHVWFLSRLLSKNYNRLKAPFLCGGAMMNTKSYNVNGSLIGQKLMTDANNQCLQRIHFPGTCKNSGLLSTHCRWITLGN